MHGILSDLKRVVPICFVTGAAMELFMIKTGFYDIVTRKEAERRLERFKAAEERRGKLQIPTASPSSPYSSGSSFEGNGEKSF
eukprot:gene3004-3278_t